MQVSRTCVVLIWTAYVLLLTSWAISNPPFMAPDEIDHYLHALALAEGQVFGHPPHFTPHESSNDPQRAWTNASTRAFRLHSEEVSPYPSCEYRDFEGPLRCSYRVIAEPEVTLRSAVGTYPPLPNIVPGLSARLAGNSLWGVRAARLANVALGAAALLLILLASSDAPVALTACGLALTPMVLFVTASVNTSAAEIVAGTTFTALGLRLIRNGWQGKWWIPMGLAGAALPLSRSAGGLWLILLIALIVATDPSAIRQRNARYVMAASGLGFAAAVGWAAAAEPALTPTLSKFFSQLGDALRGSRGVIKGLVGDFGYLTVPVPRVVVVLWLLGVAVLLAQAGLSTGRRGRLLLVATAAACVIAPIAFFVFVYAQTGYPMQARHYLPFVVALPLLAGHLLAERPRKRPLLPLLVVFVAAVLPAVHFVAWYVNFRQWTVGRHGPLIFTTASGWTPPLGIVAWVAITIAGAGALVAGYLLAGAAALRGTEERPPT
jgi:hypothetical protein